MNTKQRKRQRDIKTKLMAAICMLLVSSIMMVSTTYAWFTLSTAPEVTGINTSVGANGALEMALLPADGTLESLENTNFGTSMATESNKIANVTWGNLVSLIEKDGSDIYGLDKIKLMPAQLNINAVDGKYEIETSAPLSTPTYGYDGRVDTLTANTVTNGMNDSGAFIVAGEDDMIYGVRAVGTASAMSERQLDYRNYRATANNTRDNARSTAGTSLQTNGQALANMAIAHATGNDVFGAEDKEALQAIVDAMVGKDTKKGALDYIEDALKDYILATIASGKTQTAGLDDTAYTAGISGWSDKSLEKLMTDTTLSAHLTAFESAYELLGDLNEKMDNAQDAIDDMTDTDSATEGDQYSWTQVSAVIQYMADPDEMLVNGMTIDTVRADPNLLVNSYTQNSRLDLVLETGAGIFADIADFCGDYDTPVYLDVQYGSFHVPNMKAHMYAQTTLNAAYLDAITTAVTNLGAPVAATTGGASITDMFGYIVDLAFRTNSPDATLQLQTDATDRIYKENTNPDSETYGGGSYMQFKGSSGFDNNLVKNLMDSINVVFFDKTTGEVYGIAKPDTTATTDNTDGVIAKLYMMDYVVDEDSSVITFTGKKGTSVTYVEGTPNDADPTNNPATGHAVTTNVPTGVMVIGHTTAAENGDYSFEVSGAATGSTVSYTIGDGEAQTLTATDGTYTITGVTGDVKISVTAPSATVESDIVTLVQNTAKAISVLVYLDGDSVTNADVANAATSMTGTMNLQFSTNAILVPMDYTPLMNQGTTTGGEQQTPANP